MNSIYIATIIIALLLAQGSKVLAVLFSEHKSEWKLALTRSGGMPSTHTSLVVAMTIVLGATQGAHSPIFALSLMLAFIVIYDALNVRRSVGEQGTAIKRLVGELKLATEGYKYKEAEGHHPGEVLFGFVAGAATAAAMLYLW